MKRLSFLLLLFGLSYIAHSQIVTVTDNESGEPVEMATLISVEKDAYTMTNTKGQADISTFKGAEEIIIRILGYTTEIKSYAELQAMSFQIALSPSNLDLEAVVVSATRWSQTTSDIPSKITTISPKEITLQNPQTAADLLGTSGKVYIQKSQQGGGSPMIRGFATNRLLYTVDGVRMNTAIFRSGNIQNVISLDPFAMEGTEVLFGPGSLIYGSDAIGGVMSFQTITPDFSLTDKPLVQGKAITRYSSACNEKTGHFDINVGWKKFAFVTSISATDYEDLRMGSNGPDEYLRPFYVQRIDSMDVVVNNEDPKVQAPSGYSQINMMQKFRYKPTDKLDFQYGFHYSETSDYSRYDRHIRYKNGLPRYGEWYYGPQKWMMNNLNVNHSGNNFLYNQMTLRLAQQYFEESRISRGMNKPDREKRIEKVDAYSANLDFVKTLAKRSTLFYGVEVVLNDVSSTGINEDITSGTQEQGASRYPQSTWASYGIYLSEQFKVSEKLLFQGGLRYNQNVLNSKFDTTFYPFPFTTANLNNGALTGNLGFVWKPEVTWVISANFATAFRAPNVDDVGKVFDSEPGAVTVPNPDLKAEYAYNADIGIAKIISNMVKVDLSAYYTLLENAMVRRDYAMNGMDSIMYDGAMSKVQAIQNAAQATVYGVQAGIEIKLPQGFSFSSDFNYQVGEEELDDGTTSPSRHAPPWFGVSRLAYKAGKLSLQLNAVYNGEKSYDDLPESEKGKDYIYAIDENGNPYSPAWYTINLKAMYQIADSFLLSAGLENITDQRYRTYSSGIAAPGRNFIISMKYSF